jgi:hypothetical protein
VLAGVYVGGYVLLTDFDPGDTFRFVDEGREWLATVYEPLRVVESLVRGERVRWGVSTQVAKGGHHYRVGRGLIP